MTTHPKAFRVRIEKKMAAALSEAKVDAESPFKYIKEAVPLGTRRWAAGLLRKPNGSSPQRTDSRGRGTCKVQGRQLLDAGGAVCFGRVLEDDLEDDGLAPSAIRHWVKQDTARLKKEHPVSQLAEGSLG